MKTRCVPLMGSMAAVCFLIVTACAVMEEPTGGPEDKIPPFVIRTSPSSDSTGVSRDAPFKIFFSEKLLSSSFEDRIRTYPPIEFQRVRVKGEMVEISFRELMPETTICVHLKGGYKDHHGVRNVRNDIFHFSTTMELDRCAVSGVILFKNKPDSSGVAKLFEIRADTLIDPQRETESRIAFSGSDGWFAFRHLPADSSSFLLWAFIDKNRDGIHDAGSEFAALFPDTIVLTETAAFIDELFVNIIDPNEPGSIGGNVINMTGLDGPPMIVLFPIAAGEKPEYSLADSTGAYIINKVPPGTYTLIAFIDIRPDSICGDYVSPVDSTVTLMEPYSTLPDTLYVKPGVSMTLEPIRLENAGENER